MLTQCHAWLQCTVAEIHIEQQKTWGMSSSVFSDPPCSFFPGFSIKSPLIFPPIFFFSFVIILICNHVKGNVDIQVRWLLFSMLKKLNTHVDVYHHIYFFWVTHKCQEIYTSLSSDPFCFVSLWLYIHSWVHTSNWIYAETIAWQNNIYIYSELLLLRMSQLSKGCSNI